MTRDSYAPHGDHETLEEAVEILLGRKSGPDDPEAVEAADAVAKLAVAFNRARGASENRVRVAAVVAELHEIEGWAAGLAAAFGRASPATLDVLRGSGIHGAPISLERPDESRQLDALSDLAGRYILPMEPMTPRVELDRAVNAWSGRSRCPPEWPVGVEALRELARTRRRTFEREFRAELSRLDRTRDYGPNGALPSIRKQREKKRRANDPSTEPDVGGQENVANLMYGAPGWTLARDCYLVLRRCRPDLALMTTCGGKLHTFVVKVRAYAMGEESEGGIDHHLRAVVKIMRAREQVDGIGTLSDDDLDRRASLDIAMRSGVVPTWIK